MSKHELWELQSMQAAPLSVKVSLTKDRIREWVKHYGEDGVYVSFSGGKDSTVLLHIVREMYPDIPAVFVDVPTQYPELRQFAESFDNVTVLKPKMSFMQVCEKYGFPLISKEVAECVQGARKYLTRVIEQISLDRQTDSRTHTGLIAYVDLASLRDLTGGEYKFKFQWEKLTATGRYGGWTMEATPSDRDRLIYEAVCKCKIGGVEPQNSLQTLRESELLKELLILDSTSTTDNLRVRRMMGKGNVPITESIPSKPSKTMFSCERYQFFLDAPFEISHQCCHVMKKEPLNRYSKQTGRVPITAQMASESKLRTQVWLRNGCNAFDAKKAISNPMSFWTEQDVLLYIYQNHIPICSVYGDVVKDNEIDGQLDFEDLGIFDLGRPTLKTTGCSRTGCMLCGFGCHLEKPGEGRFERLKQTHPKMYAMLDVVKNNGVTMREAIDWINEHGNLNIRY